EVERARVSLEEKAEQLTVISKYKSEFLANMSHELRTPLNSLLILAKLLADNKEGNLSNKQVEYANTIYASGGDLLSLINEILDLSKVEAGKMQVEPRDIVLTELNQFIDRSFRPVADQKGLAFSVEVVQGTPRHIRTDPQRLQQVLKNLLSNAFKFTDQGSVKMRVKLADPDKRFDHEVLRRSRHVLAFAVTDTGIGIPKDKQRLIFEAFQQADGSTARKYGGTGLGLSISREIAKLLGGEIHVQSEPGKGSTFTLYLPPEYVGPEDDGLPPLSGGPSEPLTPRTPTLSFEPQVPSTPVPAPVQPPSPPAVAENSHVLDAALPPQVDSLLAPVTVEDDREHIREGDRVLLIIEDDLKFARIMVQLAREKGFKALVATRGDTGLSMANEYKPHAITLDIQLPVVDGWSVLDRLKRNPRTRHIPVHVISVMDKHLGNAQAAFGYLTKPVSKEGLERVFTQLAKFLERKERRLLVVEDDDVQRDSLVKLLSEGGDVAVTAVATGEEVLQKLEASEYDCLVIDLLLPDMDGVKLVEEVKTQQRFRDLPIVVYTGKELTAKDESRLRRYTGSVILKSGAKSPEHLLSDTALFLHRLDQNLPPRARAALAQRSEEGTELTGKKVLVVDDDMRNIFALTSVLENHGMQVVFAENGRAAIEMLEAHRDVDVVLMDVMMPEMDGYETMRAIRKDLKYSSLPIIAVTAKALKDDREKCMAAGASDYLPKPVDTDKLLELIRLWVTA
ncbi:MAG TPA: response regulator, partial [Myxococcus sp.]|nr:response regulator [Myxococcus sp.]